MATRDHPQRATTTEVTGWTGWILFGAILMGISGIFHMITGLTALFKETIFVVGANQLVVMNYDQWGWAHLILGAVLFLSAFSLASGQLWGRVIGVLLATLSIIANFVFFEAYPVWSLMIILVDIVLIYSIIVHGSELREDRNQYIP